MNQTISFHLHVKNNVLPKLKDEKQKDMFIDMSVFVEMIGTVAYSMLPSQFVEAQKELLLNEKVDRTSEIYSEQQ